MSENIRVVFIRKEQIAAGVYSFYFDKPAGFHFTAGQYIQIRLPSTNADDRGTTRYFTIASAPAETQMMITTRLSGRDKLSSQSSFKQALFALQPGEAVTAFGPLGTFSVED